MVNGQVLAEPVEKAGDMAELGYSGLVQFSGMLAEETRPQLRSGREVSVYKEMGRYPTIGAVLLAIDNMIRRVKWTFEPRKDSGPEGERWADFCTGCLDDMSSSWAETVSGIYSHIQYGWAFCETVLKQRLGSQPDRPGASPSSDYDDGLIGWRKIDLRSQDSLLRWEFGDHGSILGMWQQAVGQPLVFIPIERAALFRTRAYKGNPEGHSVLWSAFDPWYAVRRIKEIEAIGIERDLAGMPYGLVPNRILSSAALPEEKKALAGMRRTLSNIRRNTFEAVLWPGDRDKDGNRIYEMGLLQSGGRRQFDTSAVIERYSREIAMCVLSDWLFLGHQAVGSKSLSQVRLDQWAACLDTWNRGVCDVFDAHLTPRLLVANGAPANLAPRMKAGKVAQVDLLEFATAVSELVKSGAVVTDEDTENYVRDTAGLPPKMEQPEVPGQVGGSGQPPAPAVDQGTIAATAEA